MESYLTGVKIHGLWGESVELTINFDKHLNFLIGKNGTGKTTIINLIAAALTADFESLDRIQFDRILIKLAVSGSKKRPSIEVTKSQKKDLPYYDISYKIKTAVTDEVKTYDLDAFEEERFYRGTPPRSLRERFIKERYIYVQRQLESVVNVNWLSVYRQRSLERMDERSSSNGIDQKLEDMNNALVRYFSRLTSNFAEETANFQKTSFLSLTSIQQESDVRRNLKSIDVEHQKKSLTSVFEILGVEQSKSIKQIDQMSKELVKARKAFLDRDALSMHDLFAIVNSFKTNDIIKLYENLQSKKSIIYQPINKFKLVVNELLKPGKSIEISDQNEILIKNKSDKKISIKDLSSGEKQLLIILGQSLLQESKRVIYIADEPELSLHIEWQEKLTNAITSLNPNAQVIFATHSPDIVGPYQDNVINMEMLRK